MKKIFIFVFLFIISLCNAYIMKGHCYFEYFDPTNIDTFYPHIKEDNYLEIEFYLHDTTILLYRAVTAVKDDLSYHVEIEKFIPCRYDIVVYGDRWLRKRYRNVYLFERYAEFDFNLIAGDTNGDNIINPSDWWIIYNHLYTYHTHINYYQKANINGDNLINIEDLSICSFNQGMIGDL